jgi:hypothetical protein
MYTLWSSAEAGFSTKGLQMRTPAISTQSSSSTKPAGSAAPAGSASRSTMMWVGTGMPAAARVR